MTDQTVNCSQWAWEILKDLEVWFANVGKTYPGVWEGWVIAKTYEGTDSLHKIVADNLKKAFEFGETLDEDN